ncbi:hypothetical protein L3Y34_005911 [Caenorhabditis briggsae]|uniref:Uncharacterized protein n=1 Tax=Caenorhabditis briggsae TaxID=6238 RepID=A0AAE8ZWG0_CAEBR|nr:hypothetical protein L3Y34_005911 [Caenorhabditis briggsae]
MKPGVEQSSRSNDSLAFFPTRLFTILFHFRKFVVSRIQSLLHLRLQHPFQSSIYRRNARDSNDEPPPKCVPRRRLDREDWDLLKPSLDCFSIPLV